MSAEQKQEHLADKDFVDEKFDIERTQVDLEEEEDSPIPEVAAIVSNKDDASLPVMTFRFWFMAVFFSIFLSFFNQFFWFRTKPLTITPLVIQLLAYPLGKFMARVLPTGRLNPGPFNIKEHVLISMTANCAATCAYAVDITVIQKVYYHQDFKFWANFLLIICTQFLGFGMAGVLRRYLVYPAAMIWPGNLVQVALMNTLHQDEKLQPGQWTRFKFFCVAALGMFLYSWFPTFIFPVMASISWVCWINPKSQILSQIGGAGGLGVGAISLDWNTIISYLGSPLIVPWWAQVNIGIGFFLIAWVMVPIAYYTNLWNAKQFPIVTPELFKLDGSPYDTLAILDEDGVLDENKYAEYGPLRISTFFALTYGIGFAGLSSMITHTWLYHRHKLLAQWRQSREHSEDIHHKLMQAYPEVPDWWYASLFVVMTIVAMITCEVWPYKLPWWSVLLAVAMSAFFSLPVGLIQAVTQQQPGLNIITEYVIGYILPGRAVANVTFKVLGYISMTQALTFTSDLKLGHYMKVPPRAMFWAQMLGTFIASLVNLLTANWLLSTQKDVCTRANAEFQCPQAETFYSASVIWGVIAPERMFGPTSIYNAVNYFFVLGFFLPIPFYYFKKFYPNSALEYIHVPVVLAATGNMPPAKAYNYTNWLAIGFLFQFFARRYYPAWHLRFTYVLSAAFDTGVAFTILVMFFVIKMPGYEMPFWWGNPKESMCPLEGLAYFPVPEAKEA
ncbi:hypothetical protein BGZ81_004207 [Podila clonocystis]|nr:hypothetical protein BGZ81_004207 [Podila clonocystis]